MKNLKSLATMFIMTLLSLSLGATEIKNLNENITIIESNKTEAFINDMASTYGEFAHLGDSKRLFKLQEIYSLESQIEYARSYKTSENTVLVVMVMTNGSAVTAVQQVPASLLAQCGCHKQGNSWDFTPEIPQGEPGYCNTGCMFPG
jgi:hypothetical protein